MEHTAPVSLWDTLPDECKSMILGRLSNEEAAQLAGVSKEFAEIVKRVRRAVHLLSLPSNLSPSALQGLVIRLTVTMSEVAAHTHLKSLSFRRCSKNLRHFLPILEAAARGKPTEGSSHQRRRSLEVVDFRSCIHLSDSDVNALCVLHSRLDDINLANCHCITDAALTVLSRYEQLAIATADDVSLAKDSGDDQILLLAASEQVQEAPGREKNDEDINQPVETPQQNKEKWSDRYRRYILDEIENSCHPLPVLMDALKLTTVPKRDAARSGNPVPGLIQVDVSGTKGPVLMHIDSSGTKYLSYNVEVSGDKRLATRRKLTIPNLSVTNSESDFNTLTQNPKSLKAVLVAGATQVTDQRLQLPGRKPTDKCVEAFTTTTNDVGIFMIADAINSSEYRAELTDVDPNTDIKFLEMHTDAENVVPRTSQALALLPTALDCHSNGVAVLKTSSKEKQRGSGAVQYDTERSLQSEKISGMEPSRFRGLKALSVSGCSDITDKGVQALLKGPSKASLLSLDISKCGQVTSAGLRLPPKSALEVLTAGHMLNLTRLTLQLSRDVALQHLFLANCPKVEPYPSLPALVINCGGYCHSMLKVEGSAQSARESAASYLLLEDLCVVAPNMQTLNVSGCKKLVRFQLKCSNLSTLNFSLCENFEAFGRFYCGALLSVNAGGCRLLTPAALTTILNSASGLQELQCGGCDRLDRIEVGQLSLLHLEVSGCSSLRRLYAYSKDLKAVEACGCKNLVEVYLYSPLLRRMLFSNCPLLHTLVIPLDEIKESVDTAVKHQAKNRHLPQEGFEVSISGCNMPESVRKNLGRLTKQWQSCFKS